MNSKYKIEDFDAVYIVGGEYDLWENNVIKPSGEGLVEDIKKFLFKDIGCYFGSSAGLQLLFTSYHSEMEKGEEEKSFWYEGGFGIIQGILPEVHFDESNDMEFLRNRNLGTLKEHPEFDFGVLFSGDCVLEIDSKNPYSWKILNGKYEVQKYHTEL